MVGNHRAVAEETGTPGREAENPRPLGRGEVNLTGGCTTQSAPINAAAPAADSTPTRAVLTRQQAASVYLAAVAPANKIVAELNAAVRRQPPDITRIRDIAARGQAVERHFLDVLTATAWPADVQPVADALARDVAATISMYGTMRSVKSMADLPPDGPDSGAAQLMRSKLGLPVVPLTS
jgi:hypothetical protein